MALERGTEGLWPSGSGDLCLSCVGCIGVCGERGELRGKTRLAPQQEGEAERAPGDERCRGGSGMPPQGQDYS